MVDNPQFPELFIDGQPQPALQAALISLESKEVLNRPACLRAEFNNWGVQGGQVDYSFFDPTLLGFGRQVQVKIGSTTLFSGKIRAVEASYPPASPPRIALLAEDALADLQGEPRTRTFTDQSLADLVQSIAAANGLDSQTAFLPDVTFQELYQHNQPDLDFLMELARSFGLFASVLDQKLVVRGRLLEGEALELQLGNNLLSAEVIADLRQQHTALRISGWSRGQKQVVEASADETILQDALAGLVSGSSLLQDIFGARRATLVLAGIQDEAEAAARAEAAFRQQAQRFVQVKGVAADLPALRAGISTLLSGLGEWFDGAYQVLSATHRFDLSQGFRTEFQAARPGISGYLLPPGSRRAGKPSRKRTREKKP